ncbi:MAG: metallophosphoesterase family protein [Thermodesulfobacteriota bacterium]
MQLLCIGDIHLGRMPARLREALTGHVDPQELGPAAAWRRAVDLALERGVDGVLLAGDVVEREDDFFEAYGDLKAGVDRLVEAGIAVVAVAGNHDGAVLPRLAEAVPGFILLGRQGRWETHTLEGPDGTTLQVLGWSFPEAWVRENPLAQGLPETGSGPVLGLLHCDLDQPGSAYAPVGSADLAATPVDRWLLGHIHRPSLGGAEQRWGYLGSLTGLDPGETGPHGPWLLNVQGQWTMQQVPLAPLRWETVEVPVDAVQAAEEIQPRIIQSLKELHARIVQDGPRPRAVGVRLMLTGRSALRRQIQQRLTHDDPQQHVHAEDGMWYFVHDWQVRVQPAMDLQELARSQDPAGLLAQKILVLRDRDTPQRQELIAAAQERLHQRARQPQFAALAQEPPDAEHTAFLLEEAAMQALDELLTQREQGAA